MKIYKNIFSGGSLLPGHIVTYYKHLIFFHLKYKKNGNEPFFFRVNKYVQYLYCSKSFFGSPKKKSYEKS